MNIEHDIAKRRFFVVSDGMVAYVEYIQTESIFKITHTKVPIGLSGKGVAGQLVQYAFDYAQSSGLLFTTSCTYVQSWLARNHHFSSSPKEL